jgi:GntR family transcriptional regulator, transcriptional repressor for pyruvate dehydrogenase complex
MPARSRVHRLLPPMASSGVADTVGRRLADAIHLGLLEPGQQLPSESTLAGQLGVSTVTLREALATLRQQGLVETRRGRLGGTFVCGPTDASIGRLRTRLREMPVFGLRDFGDEWAAVAGTAARLAAARSANDQLERMRQFAVRLAAADAIGDRGRAHSRFFIEVALASQSERLTRAEVRLQSETADLLWIPSSAPFDPAEVANTLHGITAAIEAEDAAEARDRAERHVQRATRWLIETRLELTDRSLA